MSAITSKHTSYLASTNLALSIRDSQAALDELMHYYREKLDPEISNRRPVINPRCLPALPLNLAELFATKLTKEF